MSEAELEAERGRAVERVDKARTVQSWRGVAAAAARIVEIDVELAARRQPGPRNPVGGRRMGRG